MSILVHPDKNQDDADRAQQAFESKIFYFIFFFLYKFTYLIIYFLTVVNKAWKTLENEETRAKCMDVIEEAKARTDHMVKFF